MDKFINLKLASHPMNWLTVWLMLIIAGAIGHMLLSLLGVAPANAQSSYANVPAGQVPASSALAAINPQSAGLVS